MPYTIIAVCFANGEPCPHVGQHLKSFDFEYGGGVGFGEFTYNPAEAKTFSTAGEAMEFWRTTSKTQPTRYDGRPNRPLTALTCKVEKLEDSDDQAQETQAR